MLTDDEDEGPPIGTEPPVSDDAYLSSLDLWRAPGDEVGNLEATFMSDTMTYTADALYSDDSVIVKAVANHAGASVTVNGTAVDSNDTATVDLDVGANTITVMVTAADGETEMTYTITVTRAEPMTPAERYDANADGTIDADEVAMAIDDFLGLGTGTLDADGVAEVIDAFLGLS